jgi:hypothetical protein
VTSQTARGWADKPVNLFLQYYGKYIKKSHTLAIKKTTNKQTNKRAAA